MKQYQITYMASENLKDKPIKDAAPSATILNIRDDGERQLVYKIKKQNRGYFVTVSFSLDPAELSNLNKKLTTNSEIFRFLITSLKEVSEKTTKKSAQTIPAIDIPEKEVTTKVKKAEKPKTDTKAKAKKEKVVTEPEISEEDRLKALDEKLDELLKE